MIFGNGIVQCLFKSHREYLRDIWDVEPSCSDMRVP